MRDQTIRRPHRRMILVSLFAIIIGAMVLPLSGYLYVAVAGGAQSQPTAAYALPDKGMQNSAAWKDTNPRSQYWRKVRGEAAGYSTDTKAGASVLIQSSGQDWRRIRNGYISTFGPWFLLLVTLGIGLFYMLRGPVKLEQERSGRTVTRWNSKQRTLHWVTATLFVIMAIGGLSLLFGRAILRPLLGDAGFAAWASFSKVVHNYTGLLFTVCIVIMIVSWMKNNLPRRADWDWIRKGGGMFGEHAPAGRVNAGEKMWFWFIAIAGLAVCISGLVLDFPNFGSSRFTMQVANVIHSVLAIAWVGIFLGHVYIGTIGTEGALEGMTTGDVSVEWAKQHHDLWYQEITSGKQEEGNAGKTVGSVTPL
ncbi:MAG TPA: formate dehydrogenase subunit gamma [Rhodanobacter sp.]|jgi:formate dehydrogenase subunit gamma